MHILLIEDDPGDVEYVKEILPSTDIETLSMAPESLEKEYDLIIIDYFLRGKTPEEFLKMLSEIKNFKTPILIVSGKVGEVKVNAIPTNLNALILSKNEKFREMLTYYINLVCEKEVVNFALDYKTLFLDLVHDLRNDLLLCSMYKEIKKSSAQTGIDMSELEAKIINSAMYAFSRLDQLSNYLDTNQDKFLTLTEVFELIKDSQMIKDNKDFIFLQGKTDETIDFIPGFFLSVILKNLIENSCKYAGTNKKLRVDVDFSETDSDYVLSVLDNSVGMSEEKSKMLFEDKQKSKSGLGLGLVVLNRIIKSFKGSIIVHSEVGKGTSIFIRFAKSI